MADQVAGVLHGEQVFSCGHRALVDLAEFGLQLVVKRVAGFFVPEQGVLRQRAAVGNGCGQVKATIGVHRQVLPGAEYLEHRLDALAVIGQRSAADLHFDHRVAAFDVTGHLALQLLNAFARVVITTGRVNKNTRVGRAIAVAFGQQLKEGFAFDLGHGVPHRHVDGADRHRALAVTARFFVGHHAGPDLVGIQVVCAVAKQGFWRRIDQAR